MFALFLKKLVTYIVIFSSFFFLFQSSFGNYYADVEIIVSETGLVTINGITNYEDFQDIQTHKYTSKNGEMWLLNISVDEVFSDYLFRLILPENVAVNYIKTTPNIRFETIDSKLNIVGVGQNRKFELLVQYSFQDEILGDSSQNYFNDLQLVILVILIIILFSILMMYILAMRKNSLTKHLVGKSLIDNIEKENINDGENVVDDINNNNQNKDDLYKQKLKEEYSYLPLRQREIISILCEEDQITQRVLEKRLNIPKSSVSRNVHSLVIKNIIIKKESGNTNVLELNKELINK
ncbi:MAG: MarR family transcriptional regulator [Nanoarchaeota archaeon]|nr:MarR family transcriptional regulator [Nanoarchaeota archaeon]